jgi:hypothetical protein
MNGRSDLIILSALLFVDFECGPLTVAVSSAERGAKKRQLEMFPKIQRPNKNSLGPSLSSKDDQERKQKELKRSSIKLRKTVSAPGAGNASGGQLNSFYNYRIYPGNNTRVIINAFRRRKWWRPYSENHPAASNLIWEMYRNPRRYETNKYKRVTLNHIQNNNCLVTKKGLYLSLQSYCREHGLDLCDIVPLTFFLPHPSREDTNSDQQDFLQYNQTHDPESGQVWILKPASCSNRGFGILVVRGFQEVLSTIGYPSSSQDLLPPPPVNPVPVPAPAVPPPADVDENHSAPSSSSRKGWIVQSYLQSPLLISGRKFDIRCYVLLLLINGNLQAFSYQDGYIRTSGKKYHLNSLNDREIHLTNDAIQKKSKSYGKHENGNKLTYQELDRILFQQNPTLQHEHPTSIVTSHFLPQIKQQIIHSLKATREQLVDSTVKKSFELLGYDFMIDSELKTYLIEINSNPCLEFASPMLEELIDSMIEGVFQTVVDRICPPPSSSSSSDGGGGNKWEQLDLN